MNNCRVKMYQRRILSSFCTKTLHLRYERPTLWDVWGAFLGALTEFLQRGSVVFRQTMGNLVLQTKTFYSHSEHFMPVLIAVCFFLIKRITHWHISFTVTRLLTLIFLRAKDGAIFHAPYHTPARKCFCIT